MSASSKAGKVSGRKSASQAKWRRLSVLAAFGRLKPTYQMQPYSDDAIDALEEQLRKEQLRKEQLDKLGDGVVDSWQVRPGHPEDLIRNPHPPKRPPPDIEQKYQALAAECIHEYEELVLSRKRSSNKGRPSRPRRRNETGSRETLIKYLKALGIRSKRRQKRSR